MPLGDSFYSPADIPSPQIPAAQNRSLPLISQNNSPLPAEYGLYSFPDMNLVSQSPVLPFYTNPSMSRYDTLLSQLGWFAWVYKDRSLTGFVHHTHLLSVLGVDQIISDMPFTLSENFKTLQNHSPYVYGCSDTLPRAYLVNQYQIVPWPQSIDALEAPDFNPGKIALLESNPGFASAPKALFLNRPEVHQWGETHLSFTTQTQDSALLVLQKTFIPGWHATVNGTSVQPLICNLVLTAVPLQAGVNQVELTFSPTSLRLGFFLFFLFLALFTASLGLFLLA
ncbi:MAG TPA: YfhO family protein, partial [bacterium]|nr:YfhO family protein [bacterium]